MKVLLKFLFVFVLITGFISTNEAYSQRKTKSMRQIERRSKKADGFLNSSKSRKVAKAEKKAEETKKKQKESYETAKKKDVKHRMDLQSDRTKEMMKETQENSDQMRKKRREPFFKRIFRKKPH